MSEQVKEEGTFKIKSKPKQLVKNDIIKVDVTIPPDTNTFVTGFTYNDANTFTIS